MVEPINPQDHSIGVGECRDAARDAALALTAKDLISPANFDALFAPWKEVMESD